MTSARRVSALVLTVALAAGTVVGCSGDDDPSGTGGSQPATTVPQADTGEVLAAVVDGVITPGYVRLTVSLREWADALGALCTTPGTDPLERARQLWRESVTAYESTVAYEVGPAMDLRLMSDVGFAQ
ncbi:MAG TPA: imelysin family protein, partial [Acidimicrobiales bacterium]|nr:imelysin family protein [Acidimicrobiales bacterium]